MFKIKFSFDSLKKIIQKIIQKIKNDMETKTTKKNKTLLEDFEKEKILQIDKDIDNKEFLKSENCKDYLIKSKTPKIEKMTNKQKKKYYCSIHGGEGNANCEECIKKLKQLAEDNNAIIIGELE